MTRIAFHRPARLIYPEPPRDRIGVPVPPQAPRGSQQGALLTMMLPLLSTVAMAGYLISYQRPVLIALGVGFLVLSVGVTAAVRWQSRRSTSGTFRVQRERYLDMLAAARATARAAAGAARRSAAVRQPSVPRLLGLVARRRRIWERRGSDPDFLRIRVGTGRGVLGGGVELTGRLDPMADHDHELLAQAEDVVAGHRLVGHQTAWLDLARSGVVSLVGDPAGSRALARALTCQIAVLHAPEDVLIAVCTGGAAGWEWAKWLPHTREPGASAEAGVASLIAPDFGLLADFLERERDRARDEAATRRGSFRADRGGGSRRRLVVILDGYRPDAPWARAEILDSLWADAGPDLGITLVCLTASRATEPSRVDVRATLGPGGRLELSGPDHERFAKVEAATADLPDPALCEAIARRLAPLRLSEDREPVLSRITTLPEMLGVPDVGALDGRRGRVMADDPDMLRVPIGMDGEGEQVHLDLKESAQRGMGPHGLVVGATGSGKSELLRTLVTALAIRHRPELLSFVLVDFKGGATFAGVTELPHVSGLITNLADDLAMVDRVRAALQGEQQRRQQLLRDAGNVDSVREYQIRQAAGHKDVRGQPLPPLPYLLIIVDEFGELLSGRPDFIDLFVQIGRVGRSLGMHLLLATQRLEENRLRGLASHLSYRICLRTFSAGESRVVIGTPDAYHLPPVPGSAYLKVDETVYRRFRVAHVSGAYVGARDPAEDAGRPLALVPLTLRQAAAPAPAAPAPRTAAQIAAPTELQVAVDRLSRFDQPVHQVWLPPLPAAIGLGSLIGPVTEDPQRGLAAGLWSAPGGLKVPVAVVDLPLSQQQQPLVLDLSGKDGNVALVGAPQAGKSTLLRGMLLAVMLTGTPDEVQLSVIDFGGGGLLALADAPHVTGVASRLEPARARRLLAETMRAVREREELFRAEGIGSVADFRQRRDAGGLPPGTRAADLILVIDNWAAVRGEIEESDAIVVELAARGLGVGVHLVLTANRWVEIRANLRDSVGGRLELRLNDPYESEISRAVSRQLTGAVPGRGAIAPGAFFQAALPRLDDGGAGGAAAGLSEAQAKLIARIAGAWPGAPAPPVRMLPERITVAELAALAGGAPAVAVDERDLAPVAIDLARDQPHFLVFGDTGAGKSQFLRTWMRAAISGRTSADVRFLLVDYRRGLLGVVPDGFVGAYAGDPHAAGAYAAQLAERLAERRPPAAISARELRSRSWWQGPELYLVVDDLDMLATGTGSPLAVLTPFLVQGRELGFHLVAAHRSAGAARALMSGSVASRVAELGASGLLLSGDPREGAVLGGVRSAPQPPGRGLLVGRGGASLIQVAVDPEDELSLQ
jgi:DNA segregation ATPase FtsK/SpoIIIE, S-DNA-T family